MKKVLIHMGLGLGTIVAAGVAAVFGGVIGGLVATSAICYGDEEDWTDGCGGHDHGCGCGGCSCQAAGDGDDLGFGEVDPSCVSDDAVTPGLGENQVDPEYI